MADIGDPLQAHEATTDGDTGIVNSLRPQIPVNVPRVNQAIAAMQKWQRFASAAARSITIGTALFSVDT